MDNTTIDPAARWIARDAELAALAPAIRLREAGRHADAVVWLRERIEAAPEDAAAHALLAQSLWNQKADAAAGEAVERALELAPGSSLVQRSLARGLVRQGRASEALAAAQRGYELDERHPESMLVLAMALDAAGSGDEAHEMMNRATAAWPDYAEIRAIRALLRRKAGHIGDAVLDAQAAVKLKPNLVSAWALLGQLNRQAGLPSDAIAAFEKASALDPGNVAHLINLGDLFRTVDRPQDARRVLEAAVEMAPANVPAWTNLGAALQALGEAEAARNAYERVVELNPSASEALHNIGVLSKDAGDLEAALGWFDKALGYAPGDARFLASRAWTLIELNRPDEEVRAALDAAVAAWGDQVARSPDQVRAALDAAIAADGESLHRLTSLAAALHQTGRSREAIEQFNRALLAANEQDSAGEVAKAHAYRGFARLALGDFEGGWRDYEHRWRAGIIDPPGLVNASVQARLNYDVPLAALAGSRVQLVGEQGIGDQVMFASLLPDLTAVAGEVRLFGEPRLRRLFEASLPDVQIVGPEAADRPFDYLMVIGSLAPLFRNRLEDFPGKPYLRPSEGARTRWAQRLGPAEGRKRIGVSWKGGIVKTGLRARSMPLSALAPILSDPAYEIVSLQYGDNAEEIAAVNATLARPIRMFDKAEMDDFDDLAGLVMNLDLVVSVQTALVHLCGALGAPALVMVPRVAEWRYGAEGSSMPWYGSVTLFRQGEDLSWKPVVEQVAAEAARRLKAP